MRNFNYSNLKNRTWDNEILSYVAKIHEFKGKQELYLRQKPVELERLVEIAKVQSTESSNRIEGIVTTRSRLQKLVEDKTTPRNRDEKEILGYRNILNLIHENYQYIPLKSNYIEYFAATSRFASIHRFILWWKIQGFAKRNRCGFAKW